MATIPRRWRSLRLVAPLLLAGCSDSVMPKAPAERIVISGGDGQTGMPLDTMPQHLAVRVVDDAGEPVAGVAVTWSSDDPTARAIPIDMVADGEGIARAIAVLGFEPGPQAFHARVAGLDDPATFSLTAEPPTGLSARSLMNATRATHMCALDADGRAWCWGGNEYGQLGDGTTASREDARPVETDIRFVSLSGTYGNTCGIAHDASLWCWGANQQYVNGPGPYFGNGGTEGSLVPVPAASGLSIARVDLDNPMACAVSTSGDAYCWGGDFDGATLLTPAQLGASGQWRDISVNGGKLVCAIATDHAVHCMAAGADDAEAAGIPAGSETLEPVSSVPPLSSISLSWTNQCGLTAADSFAVCWGWRLNGVEASGDSPAPAYPSFGGYGAVKVIARAQSAMALATDGRVWFWGQPPGGIDGHTSYEPVELEVPGPWTDVAISEFGAFAIRAADGLVYSWNPFPGFGPPVGVLPRPVRVLQP
jgi:hypothetical protein